MPAEAGMKKLNISGGEPFLRDEFLGEIIKFSKFELGLESTGIYAMGPWSGRNGWTNMGSTSTSWAYIGRSEMGKGYTQRCFRWRTAARIEGSCSS
jgi:hypothetical protein